MSPPLLPQQVLGGPLTSCPWLLLPETGAEDCSRDPGPKQLALPGPGSRDRRKAGFLLPPTPAQVLNQNVAFAPCKDWVPFQEAPRFLAVIDQGWQMGITSYLASRCLKSPWAGPEQGGRSTLINWPMQAAPLQIAGDHPLASSLAQPDSHH